MKDTDSPKPLHGVNAVVTGASSGIGREIAIQFAAAGCANLIVHCNRNLDAAKATAANIRDVGTAAMVDQCDFANLDNTSDFIARAFDNLGRIDAWVHCAGADVLTGDAANLSFYEKLSHLIDVDLVGSIHTGRVVGERLHEQARDVADQEPPAMLFLGWDQAFEGMEGDGAQMFAPIKAGVEAFAKSLAQELAPLVRVNTIAPGWIKTAWGTNTSEYWNERAINQSLMQRWGEPADIAAAAVFLCSPANRFVTSQTLTINGGWNRRF